MGCTKKLIPQFVCTYHLWLLPKVHSTILSIQNVDNTPVERTHQIEPLQKPVPGLIAIDYNAFRTCLARLVTNAPLFSRPVPILKRLYWLLSSFAFILKYAQ